MLSNIQLSDLHKQGMHIETHCTCTQSLQIISAYISKPICASQIICCFTVGFKMNGAGCSDYKNTTHALYCFLGSREKLEECCKADYLKRYLMPRNDSRVWPKISCTTVAWAYNAKAFAQNWITLQREQVTDYAVRTVQRHPRCKQSQPNCKMFLTQQAEMKRKIM